MRISTLSKISQWVAQNEVTWNIIGRHLVRIGQSCVFWHTRQVADRAGRDIFASLVVRNGPFQGMRYP